MELGNKLSAQNVCDFNNFVNEIAEKMIAAEIDDSEFNLSITMDFLPSFNTPPSEIRIGLNILENKIHCLNDAPFDWVNPYSRLESLSRLPGAMYNHIKTWYDWANYQYGILTGEIEKEQYLYTIEDGEEQQLFDSEHQPILTKEGYIQIS